MRRPPPPQLPGSSTDGERRTPQLQAGPEQPVHPRRPLQVPAALYLDPLNNHGNKYPLPYLNQLNPSGNNGPTTSAKGHPAARRHRNGQTTDPTGSLLNYLNLRDYHNNGLYKHSLLYLNPPLLYPNPLDNPNEPNELNYYDHYKGDNLEHPTLDLTTQLLYKNQQNYHNNLDGNNQLQPYYLHPRTYLQLTDANPLDNHHSKGREGTHPARTKEETLEYPNYLDYLRHLPYHDHHSGDCTHRATSSRCST